jgi:hypothetical protein
VEAARDAHALLAEMGRLLGELEDLLGAAADLSAGPFSAPPHPIAADLSAGPFTATAEVELFGARLRALAGVVDVVHRGFAGERALFEVDLGVPR